MHTSIGLLFRPLAYDLLTMNRSFILDELFSVCVFTVYFLPTVNDNMFFDRTLFIS